MSFRDSRYPLLELSSSNCLKKRKKERERQRDRETETEKREKERYNYEENGYINKQIHMSLKEDRILRIL